MLYCNNYDGKGLAAFIYKGAQTGGEAKPKVEMIRKRHTEELRARHERNTKGRQKTLGKCRHWSLSKMKSLENAQHWGRRENQHSLSCWGKVSTEEVFKSVGNFYQVI